MESAPLNITFRHKLLNELPLRVCWCGCMCVCRRSQGMRHMVPSSQQQVLVQSNLREPSSSRSCVPPPHHHQFIVNGFNRPAAQVNDSANYSRSYHGMPKRTDSKPKLFHGQRMTVPRMIDRVTVTQQRSETGRTGYQIIRIFDKHTLILLLPTATTQ